MYTGVNNRQASVPAPSSEEQFVNITSRKASNAVTDSFVNINGPYRSGLMLRFVGLPLKPFPVLASTEAGDDGYPHYNPADDC